MAPSFMVSTMTLYGCSAPISVKTRSLSAVETTRPSTSPPWIARRVSSASIIRDVSSCNSSKSCWRVLCGSFIDSYSGFLRFQINAYKKPFRIRHVADEPPEWQRECFDERWGGNNVLSLGPLGLLVDIYHLEFVTACQVFITDSLDICDCLG